MNDAAEIAPAPASGKVTVLMSTFNGARYLQQQLDSLYAQTHRDLRILVRDDGSGDATHELLEAARAQGRIEILESHDNRGATQSFFALLDHAARSDADFVAFCDQDDVWLPEKVARAVTRLSELPQDRPALYCARAELVDEDLNPLGHTERPRRIGFGNALVNSIAAGCTMMLNRAALQQLAGRLPKNVYIHDWWCYLVVSCIGEVVYDEVSTIRYRQHRGNVIGVPNEFGRYVKKFRRFFGDAGGRTWMSDQAALLRELYKDSIPPDAQRLLDDFVAGKTSLLRRIQLALSCRIWRQRRLDDLLLRVLILLNRY